MPGKPFPASFSRLSGVPYGVGCLQHLLLIVPTVPSLLLRGGRLTEPVTRPFLFAFSDKQPLIDDCLQAAIKIQIGDPGSQAPTDVVRGGIWMAADIL